MVFYHGICPIPEGMLDGLGGVGECQVSTELSLVPTRRMCMLECTQVRSIDPHLIVPHATWSI